MPAYTNVTLKCDAPHCNETVDVRCELTVMPPGERAPMEHLQMLVEVRPPAGWWHGERSGYGLEDYVCACPDHVTKLRGW